MASKSASGAAKRKIKKQKEESVKRMPKIDIYLKQNHEETEKEQDIDNLGILLNTINTASKSALEPTAISSIDTINTKNVEPNIFNSLICEYFPTDKVNFKEPLSHQEKVLSFLKALVSLRAHFQLTVIILDNFQKNFIILQIRLILL